MSHRKRCVQIATLLLLSPLSAFGEWQRHTIDSSSQGADGVRIEDINGDGHPDVATGWEEGGLIRVYLHPGYESVKQPWPKITVGEVTSPEDAILVDFDGDGTWEVLSSCEGKTKTIFAHWATTPRLAYNDSTRWQTLPVLITQKKESWMFALQLTPGSGSSNSIIVGSKGGNASVSEIRVPKNFKEVDQWKINRLYDAGWIMSLREFDFDADGDQDVLVSDRRGPKSGVLWLENPGPSQQEKTARWTEHRIGAFGEEVMFLDLTVKPRENEIAIAVYAKPNQIFQFTAKAGQNPTWTSQRATVSAKIGTAKAVRYTDVNLDGQMDLVATCENANEGHIGVYWFSVSENQGSTIDRIHDISGPNGIKFDRIETLDLDGDGDLDVMTCEERDNLGVIWYENPVR
ncbi:VCBS repeat-containing protein [Verrucomicrobia bacterium]|nr:VCBS repeat-containing protein [Verrucomicrobiota bacterium]